MEFSITDRDPSNSEAAIYVMSYAEQIFYVGSTTTPLRSRAKCFKYEHKFSDVEATVVMSVVKYVPTTERYRVEKEVINFFLSNGHDLINVTLTPKFNAMRSEMMAGKGRKPIEFCKRGHNMSENARASIDRNGWVKRTCRICQAENNRNWRAKQKEK